MWKGKAGGLVEKRWQKKKKQRRILDVMAPTHFPRHHMTQSEKST